ncbi:MAG TPA: aquaporin, partial [Oscillatoriaceae cyanobacterium]
HALLPDPVVRRAIMAIAMGLTAVAIIYSPWGQRSGAHINPAVTLAFLYLGKIAPVDALAYVIFQFLGASAGVGIARILFGPAIADPHVAYVVTVPGPWGVTGAFGLEFGISFLLMLTVLTLANQARVARFTGLAAGTLLALYVLFESPFSGTSMNPARTFGSAIWGQNWTAWWLYFLAPPLAMLLAAELYSRLASSESILCAKLHHTHNVRCIFHCGYAPQAPPRAPNFDQLRLESWQDIL